MNAFAPEVERSLNLFDFCYAIAHGRLCCQRRLLNCRAIHRLCALNNPCDRCIQDIVLSCICTGQFKAFTATTGLRSL